MRPSELLKFLQQAQDDFGCLDVALRCDCENLETVHLIDRSGELAVTDRGETFQYLDLSLWFRCGRGGRRQPDRQQLAEDLDRDPCSRRGDTAGVGHL